MLITRYVLCMALTYAHNPEILVMHRINAHTKIHMFQSKLISTVQYLAYQFIFMAMIKKLYVKWIIIILGGTTIYHSSFSIKFFHMRNNTTPSMKLKKRVFLHVKPRGLNYTRKIVLRKKLRFQSHAIPTLNINIKTQ